VCGDAESLLCFAADIYGIVAKIIAVQAL
jgi:hypothetical protein